MHTTAIKFGYPATLVREFEHWLVLARPAQVTLGSLVLTAKSDATAFGMLPAEAYAELGQVVPAIEQALGTFVGFEKINYLMLMMVDREVHFHVLPRYSGERGWSGLALRDQGWPGQPDLPSAVALDSEQLAALTKDLKQAFA